MNDITKKECVLIIGMHRSATSATAGCLNHVGYNAGTDLFQPDAFNQKGYFENRKINYFNDDLLSHLNARWDDTFHLSNTLSADEIDETFHTRLEVIIRSEFGEANRIVIKDPRISFFLPLYVRVLSQFGFAIKIIVNFRNPYEIAKSLKTRDNFSISKSLLLWMDYTLRAEKYSRTLQRAFVDYSDLINKPSETFKKIDAIIGLQSNEKLIEESGINSFIEPGLKHHAENENADHPNIPPLFDDFYLLLKTMAQSEISSDNPEKFDVKSERFYSHLKFYHGLPPDAGNNDLFVQRDEEQKNLHTKAAKLEGEIRELNLILQDKIQEIDTFKNEIGHLKINNQQQIDDLEKKSRELSNLKMELSGKIKILIEKESTIGEMENSKSWKIGRAITMPVRILKKFFNLDN